MIFIEHLFPLRAESQAGESVAGGISEPMRKITFELRRELPVFVGLHAHTDRQSQIIAMDKISEVRLDVETEPLVAKLRHVEPPEIGQLVE